MQIRSYASAIMNDPRFDQQNVSWEDWLIGTGMKDTVNESRNQPHLPQVLFKQPHTESL